MLIQVGHHNSSSAVVKVDDTLEISISTLNIKLYNWKAPITIARNQVNPDIFSLPLLLDLFLNYLAFYSINLKTEVNVKYGLHIQIPYSKN